MKKTTKKTVVSKKKVSKSKVIVGGSNKRTGRYNFSFKNPFVLGALIFSTIVASYFIYNSFAATSTQTLWSSRARPANASASDTKAVELGLRFKAAKSGFVTGARFYKGPANKGKHTATLWNASGNALATAQFTNETQLGWQTVKFDKPVAVQANTVYVVSYFAPLGRYAYNDNYFSSTRTRGDLIAPSNSEAKGNGVYKYGGGFPSESYRSTNYWVDVLFETSTPTTTPKATPTPTPTPTPSPKPTPTPTQSPTPVPTPVPAPTLNGWPNASNTGVPAGTALSIVNGDLTVTQAGAIIDAKDVRGKIYVRANNVTIKRTKATGGIQIRSDLGNTGLVIEDTEMGPSSGSGGDDGISFDNYTCVRCNIHNFSDGGKLNGNVTIVDSYIHDLYQKSGDHNDGLQNYAGSGNVTIKHSTISGAPTNVSDVGNAAIFMADYPTGTMTIDGCLLSGGQYTLQALDNAKYVIINNRFVRGSYNYGTHRVSNPSNVTWSNNAFSDNNQAISL